LELITLKTVYVSLTWFGPILARPHCAWHAHRRHLFPPRPGYESSPRQIECRVLIVRIANHDRRIVVVRWCTRYCRSAAARDGEAAAALSHIAGPTDIRHVPCVDASRHGSRRLARPPTRSIVAVDRRSINSSGTYCMQCDRGGGGSLLQWRRRSRGPPVKHCSRHTN